MTCREKLKMEHPEYVNEELVSGCNFCPSYFGYLPNPIDGCGSMSCKDCWDREIPKKPEKKKKAIYAHVGPFHEDYDKVSEFATLDTFIPNTAREAVGLPKITDEFNEIPNKQIVTPEETRHILDSGARREFGTGAVRDIQEGKGRADLLPIDVAAIFYEDDNAIPDIFNAIHMFKQDGNVIHLFRAIEDFQKLIWDHRETMLLEVSIHFEEGAKKYGENNWQKGIPVHCYIDSAVRHYLKFLRGDKDEPHDRAFCWNLMCAIWTCKHKPELNEYAAEEE